MPRKPRRPCKWLGCPALVESGYCPTHEKKVKQQDDAYRGSAASRGYDARWHNYRDWYLRQHPLCVACRAENSVQAATVVDHIIPLVKGGEMYVEANLRWLGVAHHAKKTSIETRG